MLNKEPEDFRFGFFVVLKGIRMKGCFSVSIQQFGRDVAAVFGEFFHDFLVGLGDVVY